MSAKPLDNAEGADRSEAIRGGAQDSAAQRAARHSCGQSVPLAETPAGGANREVLEPGQSQGSGRVHLSELDRQRVRRRALESLTHAPECDLGEDCSCGVHELELLRVHLDLDMAEAALLLEALEPHLTKACVYGLEEAEARLRALVNRIARAVIEVVANGADHDRSS